MKLGQRRKANKDDCSSKQSSTNIDLELWIADYGLSLRVPDEDWQENVEQGRSVVSHLRVLSRDVVSFTQLIFMLCLGFTFVHQDLCSFEPIRIVEGEIKAKDAVIHSKFSVPCG